MDLVIWDMGCGCYDVLIVLSFCQIDELWGMIMGKWLWIIFGCKDYLVFQDWFIDVWVCYLYLQVGLFVLIGCGVVDCVIVKFGVECWIGVVVLYFLMVVLIFK